MACPRRRGPAVTTRGRRTAALLATTVVTGLLTAALPAGAATSGDDYPYRADTTQSADRWGFTKRQCVSFAAWRLAQHSHTISNSRQRWGSAYHWDETARALGDLVSRTPQVGTIAQWNAYESSPYYGGGSTTTNGTMRAGGYGHVAYVTRVWADRSVSVEQYNLNGARSYSSVHVKAPRYLYVK